MIKLQFVRFLSAGAANALAGYVIYSLLIIAGYAVWFSLAVNYVFGITFSFVVMGTWVFQNCRWSMFPRFVLLHVSIFFVNLKLIEFLSAMSAGLLLAQAILVLPIAIISYVLLKRFVFRPATHLPQ